MNRPQDIFSELGVLALASRLRRLSETMMAEGEEIYIDLGLVFKPRWFPAFYALSKRGPLAVGELAGSLGITHTAAANIMRETVHAGLVETAPGARKDRRKSTYALTAEGRRMLPRLEPVWREIKRSVGELLAETGTDLLGDIERFERAFALRSVVDRVRERLNLRPRRRLEIVEYRPAYKKHFRSLNEQWLREYFTVEREDAELLADPMRRIIRGGGSVLFALYDGEVVGTCALKKHRGGRLELCKMAVRPDFRRRGIGEALLRTVIERARSAGHKELFLFTSLELEAAGRLYRRVGFRRIARSPIGDCRLVRECIPMRIKLDRSSRSGD